VFSHVKKQPEHTLDPKKQQLAALQHRQLNHKIHTAGHNGAQYGANICIQENLNYAVNNKQIISTLKFIKNKIDTNFFLGQIWGFTLICF
jgi:hypothetical protein